jgi:hypothetical protein
MLMAQCIFFMFLDGNGCVAKAGKFMGGCLDFQVLHTQTPVVHVMPCVMSIEIAVMILTGSSVAVRINVRDIYGKGEDMCRFGKFSRR